MIRPLAAAAAAAAALACAGVASAQSWGGPIYLNAHGRPVGGTPLSEVETRSYVRTGRWADGYADGPRIYIPAPGYGRRYARYESAHRSSGGRHGYGGGPYDAPPRTGYRDAWGYDDDRPPSAWRGRTGRAVDRRPEPGCDCPDVYFHDR